MRDWVDQQCSPTRNKRLGWSAMLTYKIWETESINNAQFLDMRDWVDQQCSPTRYETLDWSAMLTFKIWETSLISNVHLQDMRDWVDKQCSPTRYERLGWSAMRIFSIWGIELISYAPPQDLLRFWKNLYLWGIWKLGEFKFHYKHKIKIENTYHKRYVNIIIDWLTLQKLWNSRDDVLGHK